MKKLCAVIGACLIFSACNNYSTAGLFNAGNEAYRQEQWTEARSCYLQALDKSFSDRMSALIYYNLGNTKVKELLAASSETSKSDTLNSAAELRDPAARWKEILELYCLAQQFYGETFPEAAVNAEWVRLRIKQNTTDRNNDIDKKQEKEKSKNDEAGEAGKTGKNGSGSTENPGNRSVEQETSDTHNASESQNDSENSENRNDDTNSNQMAEDADSTAFSEENGEKNAVAEEISADEFSSSLSPEETARMKTAVDLLEQEETSRRQRPSFRRLPSYDDTEKNW